LLVDRPERTAKQKWKLQMSLLKNTPAFESDDAAGVAEASAAATSATPTATAVAVAAPAALAVSNKLDMKVLDRLEDALEVDYNTLAQIITTNGNFVDRETKTNLGDTVLFELLSYQKSFVISPNDDKAPREDVRYSRDRITCSDDTPVAEHLQWLRENGYPKASIKDRVVVVAALQVCAKNGDTFNGTLAQFDLSPASKVQFDRYKANTAYALAKGSITAEQAVQIKATTELAQKGTDTYTIAKFTVAV